MSSNQQKVFLPQNGLIGKKFGPYDLSALSDWEMDFWHVVATKGELPAVPKSGSYKTVTAQLQTNDPDNPGNMKQTAIITADGKIRNVADFDPAVHIV